MKFSKKFTDFWLLLLRVGASAAMLTHGFPKFTKLFEEGELSFADPIGIGEFPSLLLVIFAEFICPIFIILGYKTRYFCLPIIITMLVAALVVHGNDPFSSQEKAWLFVLIFGTIAVVGSGRYSLNAWLDKKQ